MLIDAEFGPELATPLWQEVQVSSCPPEPSGAPVRDATAPPELLESLLLMDPNPKTRTAKNEIGISVFFIVCFVFTWPHLIKTAVPYFFVIAIFDRIVCDSFFVIAFLGGGHCI